MKILRQSKNVGSLCDSPHKKLAEHRYQTSCNEERQNRAAPAQTLVFAGSPSFFMGVSLVEMCMRLQYKDQAQAIGDKQNQGNLQTQVLLIHSRIVLHQMVKDGRKNERYCGERQERRAERRGRRVETLLLVLESTRNDAQTQYQQHVADDRAGN